MKVFMKICGFISALLTVISVFSLTWGLRAFLGAYPEPFWKGIFVCIVICIVGFSYVWFFETVLSKKFNSPKNNKEDTNE